jgi:hypothetical protein
MRHHEWHVTCDACQEPVGMPWYRHGCNCDGELNDQQKELLEVINAAWDNTPWEEDASQESGFKKLFRRKERRIAELDLPCICGHAQSVHNRIFVNVKKKANLGMCNWCECESFR